MAGDLGGQPDSGLMVQLCGDAHVLNFGRDLDETLRHRSRHGGEPARLDRSYGASE